MRDRMQDRVQALRAFVVKELRHILRDRQTLAILLLLPLAQVVLFGFVLRTDVNDVRIVFVDPAPDYATVAVRSRFAGTGGSMSSGLSRRRRSSSRSSTATTPISPWFSTPVSDDTSLTARPPESC